MGQPHTFLARRQQHAALDALLKEHPGGIQVGLDRIVALCFYSLPYCTVKAEFDRSSTSYQIHEHIQGLGFDELAQQTDLALHQVGTVGVGARHYRPS